MDVTYFPRYRNAALYSRPDFLGLLIPMPPEFNAATWDKSWTNMTTAEQENVRDYYDKERLKASAARAGTGIFDYLKTTFLPKPAAAPAMPGAPPGGGEKEKEEEEKYLGLTKNQLMIAGGGLGVLILILALSRRR